jgi:hypothetical protein
MLLDPHKALLLTAEHCRCGVANCLGVGGASCKVGHALLPDETGGTWTVAEHAAGLGVSVLSRCVTSPPRRPAPLYGSIWRLPMPWTHARPYLILVADSLG